MARIQLVDDDPLILRTLQRAMRDAGWELEPFDDPVLALHALAEKPYEVIVCDHHMPDIDGVTYLQFAKQCQPASIRILLSGMADHQALMQAINQAEIYRFIPKPWENEELLATVRGALTLYRTREHDRRELDLLQIHKHRGEAERMQIKVLKTRHGELYEVQRDEQGRIVLDGEE
ncbi:hypothetical protein PHLH8_25610 [Pseudomonas sp. Pc102]|uniref:response regulator n=1 Tax=Pseudomonas sp. Pc102 TaxID=2678261 RepID=UPI001BCE7F62|nr:response regulator [Pseudomonas sp. Pc102]BBP82919.1 hypothetical protein PHLH8_25610 [Pseudomonas sp. Pc102]